MKGEFLGQKCMRLANDTELIRWIEAIMNSGIDMLHLFIEILIPVLDPFHGEA